MKSTGLVGIVLALSIGTGYWYRTTPLAVSKSTEKAPLEPQITADSLKFQGFFVNEKGLRIFYTEYNAPKAVPKGRVFISHGYGEHSGRYQWVADKFLADGFAVYTMDHQGHGYSDGDRAYVEKFQDYANDFNQFVTMIINKSKDNVPNFLLAHSLGGTIALLAAHDNPSVWKCVFLSAPAVIVDPDIAKPHLVAIAGTLSYYLPKLSLPDENIPPERVSRDPEIVAKYKTDPLIYHGSIKARMGAESLQTFEKIEKQIVPAWTLPLFTAHGTGDGVTKLAGSEYLYDHSLKCQDKKKKFYPGYFHELLNEPGEDKVTVYNDVVEWFNSHNN